MGILDAAKDLLKAARKIAAVDPLDPWDAVPDCPFCTRPLYGKLRHADDCGWLEICRAIKKLEDEADGEPAKERKP